MSTKRRLKRADRKCVGERLFSEECNRDISTAWSFGFACAGPRKETVARFPVARASFCRSLHERFNQDRGYVAGSFREGVSVPDASPANGIDTIMAVPFSLD